MKKYIPTFVAVLMTLASYQFAEAEEISKHLQNISVTVKAPGNFGTSQGSGVIITRELRASKEDNTKSSVNFVWTAAHVVDNLRSVRTITKNGQTKKVVEFKDAQIVQELVENGRKVGEVKMDCKVIRYSDADEGEDLALLMVRKKGFVKPSAEFYLGDEIIPIGTELFHVGSLLGQVGSNSMTRGIMSKVGRVLDIGEGEGTVFDQTTVTAFPGSSGGGVYLSDKNGDTSGKYVGMLVRGAGEGFNFIVPVRRMQDWAKKVDAEWALDPDAELPTLEDLKKQQAIEDAGFGQDEEKKEEDANKKYGIKFMIIKTPKAPLVPIEKRPSNLLLDFH
tara:strand:+ start:761 stop:1765 length:1005 start_codon:yes stop_codon:yes gene_type:complete